MQLNFICNSHLKDKKKIKELIILFAFRLIKYRNSSYTRNSQNKKSIMEYYYFMNSAVVF